MWSQIVRLGYVALTLGVAVTAVARPAKALTINAEFDSTVTRLANAATVEQAFNTVSAAYASALNDPVTVNVQVSWGRVASYALPSNAIGASIDQLYGYYSYSQVRSLLWADATTPADIAAVWHTPTSAPAAVASWVIPSATAKALGVIGASNAAIDGSIGFTGNSETDYTYTGSLIAPDTYDFVAIAEHELAEVLGRISGLSSDTPSWRTPLDLFRYGAPSVLSFDYNTPAYLSVDGGYNSIGNFNYLGTGDRGDWLTTALTRDSQDAYLGRGEHAALTAADLEALDLIGWHGGPWLYGASNPTPVIAPSAAVQASPSAALQSVPEPSSLALVAVALAVIGLARRLRI